MYLTILFGVGTGLCTGTRDGGSDMCRWGGGWKPWTGGGFNSAVVEFIVDATDVFKSPSVIDSGRVKGDVQGMSF